MSDRFRTRQLLALLLGVVALLSLLPARAQDPGESGWARHNRIFVVPASKKVIVDGKLDDWDLSGMIQMYVLKSTSDVQSGKLAMMYDKDALYIGAEVRDPSPMMNRQDPAAHGDWGWDADSFQMRMVTDAALGYPINYGSYAGVEKGDERQVNLLAWYYTDTKQAVLQGDTSFAHTALPGTLKYGVFPEKSYQGAYRLGADKSSYTFEYRIPWSTLHLKKLPVAGDVWPGTCQFNWGRADGLRYAAFVYDVMSRPGFPYQSSACWGRIQFSAKGNLPRELVEEGVPPEKPMPLRFEYNLPKDGEVTIELFNEKNEIVRTIAAQAPRTAGKVVELWDGLDDAGKPVPAGTYAWKGLYHDPITTKFVLSVHNSGNPPYKTDDNTGGWGGDYDAPRDVCIVGDVATMCWASAEAGWGIIRTDLDGKKKWGTLNGGQYLASDGKLLFSAGSIGFDHFAGVRAMSLADGANKTFGNGESLIKPLGPDEAEGEVSGLAYNNGIIYIAYARQNKVFLYDVAQGAQKAVWTVPAPGRMAVRPDGSLLVISEGKVLQVRDGAAQPLITDRLDDPQGVAVDKDGLIYVSNRGKLSNISVFAADGKYLRSIGKEGGRPARGTYDPSGVYMAGGIATDARGRLWVTESTDAPKRISVWETATGKLAAEYFGGSTYSTFTWMDPKHPDEVYCHDVLWKVDLDKKTWRPESTVWRSLDPNAPGAALQFYVFTAKNGRQYAWGSIHPRGCALYIREGDLFKPIAVVFSKWGTLYDGFPAVGDKAKYPEGGYGWVDANNDQLVQENEVTRIDWAYQYDPRNVFFSWVDSDLNLWSGGGFRYHPTRIGEDGRPAYDFNKPEKTGITTGFSEFTPIWVDSQDGSVFTKTDDAKSLAAVARWSPDAKLQWGFRGSLYWANAVALPPLKPGKLWGMTGCLGVAGDYTGMADYFGVTHLVTRDGLYVAMIGKPNATVTTLTPETVVCEYFYAQLVKPEGMGNRYFLLNGDQDGRVSEVFGLDTVQRLPGGTYTISQEMIDTAMAKYAEYQAKIAQGQNFTLIRTRAALSEARPVRKVLDDVRSFEVRAAYDEKNLYLKYNVSSQNPLVNSIPDYRLIFKGGNLLDIQMATDPNADPKRTKPAPGDLRILVTQRDGKTVAVIYKPKVKDFAGKAEVLISPTGSESFDSIEQTDRIGLEYRATTGVQGFEALVTIPLDLLGWTPKASGKVRMDVGYIFGNANGTQASKRSYWHNNGFSANIVNDVPNESRLTPAEWGEVNIE